VLAIWTEPKQSYFATTDQFLEIRFPHVFEHVIGIRVIGLVHCNRVRIVIDGDVWTTS
jgi:hypothetical protein